jgi:outer membrane lipoprotein-sorting protein
MMARHSIALALGAVLLAAGLAPCIARAATPTPAIAAFDEAFAHTSDYTYTLRSHEAKGGSTQDRVYAYSFMKPHFAKTLIVSGDGNGSGGVWAGGNQVSGHQGGVFSSFHLKVDLHDGRAISMLGLTIPDGLIQNVVAQYVTTPGSISQHIGGRIDGVQTQVVTLDLSSPNSIGVTRMQIYFSDATHWPVRNIEWADGTPILDQSFLNVKTNVGLSQNDFPF